jgi:3-deoxy-D-manno-octulosonate 8-phosphate phosphatase (KDO 8-P phosphatase)
MSIELLVLDVDGVLTDNTFLLHGESGEWKAFCAADGFGLRKLQDEGVQVAFLSGRNSAAVERRGRELGVALVVQGKSDKRRLFPRVCGQLGVSPRAAAYMGDDLVDLPALRMAGFSAAPCNARPEVRDVVDFVSAAAGGHGAVREVCEELLRRMGRWDAIVQGYLD